MSGFKQGNGRTGFAAFKYSNLSRTWQIWQKGVPIHSAPLWCAFLCYKGENKKNYISQALSAGFYDLGSDNVSTHARSRKQKQDPFAGLCDLLLTGRSVGYGICAAWFRIQALASWMLRCRAQVVPYLFIFFFQCVLVGLLWLLR